MLIWEQGSEFDMITLKLFCMHVGEPYTKGSARNSRIRDIRGECERQASGTLTRLHDASEISVIFVFV